MTCRTKFIAYILAPLIAFSGPAAAAEFRFSPRPNKAHLIQWRQWDAEALEEAKTTQKLILLSLSAAWCHWCHVMDETTYSDEAVIGFVNGNFIPVRVDADMRPDVDSLYNQGGWPSTAILTPEGEVIDGGNYLPPEEMLGRLKRADALYAADREGIAKRIEQARMMRSLRQGSPLTSSPGKGDIESIAALLKDAFNEQYGGFGTGQKFPNPDALDFLLSVHAKNRDRDVRKIITKTLDGMATGGIHDKIDGGFFRYATKPDWSEPHYEKMLDVNAGMIKNYAEAYRALGEKRYRAVLRETVQYVRNNLFDSTHGTFYGSQDADESYYSKKDRKGLKQPVVDKTSYADASSLMISALVSAHCTTGEGRYLDMAEKGADFIIRNMYSGEDGVFHYYRDSASRLPGLLSDNALFGSALLNLYNATGKRRYLALARRIGGIIVERFFDTASNQFRSSIGTAITQPATAGILSDVNHNLANYRALCFLGRLLYAGPPDDRMSNARDAALMTFAGQYRRFSPLAAAYGRALLWKVETPVEITVLGDRARVREFLSIANSVFIPEKVVRVLSLSEDKEEVRRLNYPLKEAVYLCAGKRCSKPINGPGKLKEELKRFLEKP